MTRILFVCMGNICRSPMAEAVFDHLADLASRTHEFETDSAGIGGWHEGETADPRTLSTLSHHQIPYAGRARQIRDEDFDKFDALVAMDFQNQDDMLRLRPDARKKVSLLMDWATETTVQQVPDPYYGGREGFQHVYDLVTLGSKGLLAKIAESQKKGV